MISNTTKYITRIRNPDKRQYAIDWLLWLRGGEIGEAPDNANLSYMAKQAVRMQICDLERC